MKCGAGSPKQTRRLPSSNTQESPVFSEGLIALPELTVPLGANRV